MAVNLNNPTGVQPQQQKGSGFVNLDKILQANSGNNLAGAISGNLTQGAQQVQQGLGQVKNDFQQQANSNDLASDKNKQAVSDALKNIAGGQTDVSDPQATQFGTYLAGQYAGPKTLDSTKTSQLGARGQELQDFGKSLTSGGDKTRLLQAFAGQGPYSYGQNKLDSLLLGQGPQAGQQLAQARQQTRGLTQQIGNEQQNAQQIAQLQQGKAQQFGQDVRGQVGLDAAGNIADTGAIPDFLKNLDTRATGAQTKQAADLQGFQSLLQKIQDSRGIDPINQPNLSTQLSSYGLSPDDERYLQRLQGQELYGATLNPSGSNFVQAADQASRSSIANAGDLAKAQALAKLSGTDFSKFALDPNAAKYDPAHPFTYDVQNLKNEIGQHQAAYNQEVSGITAQQQQLADQYKEATRGNLNGLTSPADLARQKQYYDQLYALDQQKRAVQDKYGLKYRMTPTERKMPTPTGGESRGPI